jgi:penicillin-binding protein 2
MKFGKAFSDNVVFERERKGLFSSPNPSWWYGAGRPLLFTSVMVLAFFILLWRLFSLTVINGHAYRLLSDTNKTKQLIIHAPRGELLDRTGKPLASNVPFFRILKPCSADPNTVCPTITSWEEGEALKAKGLPPKWFLEPDYKRVYSAPETLFHVMGYVGQVNEAELSDEFYILRGYRMGDTIGRSGAEAVFEEELRGKDGKEFVEVDAQGAIVRILGQTPEVKGSSVTLSLDKGLSDVVASAFPKGEKGAVVVSKPATGEILALYSSPTFSSDILSRGMDVSQYNALIDNPDRPLFDRVIGGVYPPGSTFKLVVATGALEEGVIKKDTVIEDTGEIKIGLFTFPNWYFKQYGKTEGMVDIVKAVQRSNDIFFYKAGEWLGITKLGTWAKKMGVGNLLGIELPGEASGLMPDPAWKNMMFTTAQDITAKNNEWYLGDTYHVSIGQGYLLTTPLQVNTWTNVIANGGKLCTPTIKKYTSDSRQTSKCKSVGIKKETIDLITKGMTKACETGGTGYPLFNFKVRSSVIPAKAGIQNDSVDNQGIPHQVRDDKEASSSGHFVSIPVACKTGTAEFGILSGPGAQKPHAWFTAFAPIPSENISSQGRALEANTISGEPEISVTVLIEGAGEGSDKAAPVAKKILEEWFSR